MKFSEYLKSIWKKAKAEPEPEPMIMTFTLPNSGAEVIIVDGIKDALDRPYMQITMKRRDPEPDEKVWRWQQKHWDREVIIITLTELKRVTGADEAARQKGTTE